MGQAVNQAFDLITSGNKLLGEIVGTTMHMALSSSLLALLIGVPIGVLVATSRFPGKKIVIVIMRTLMGLPPVVVGIVLYILFSGTGPFGSLRLVYSLELMIIAQVCLIAPIVAGMTETQVSSISAPILETSRGLGLNKLKVQLLTINESKYQIAAIYLFAFARAISEVGAVQIVGGNILHKTRVMTTTIALNYNTGQFTYAVALGIILLLIALVANLIASLLQRRAK